MTELLDVIDELTLPKPVKVPTDTGHTWATEDALLTQLQEAISSTTGRAGGRSAAHTRSILDADALYQFHQITSTIGDWCRVAGAKVTRDPVVDLRAWYVATLAKNDTTEFYLRKLQSWVKLIRAKLAPVRTEEWLSPCPVCDANTWVNEENETILHPVLIEYDPDAIMATIRWTCRACGEVQHGEFAQRYLAFEAEKRQRAANE